LTFKFLLFAALIAVLFFVGKRALSGSGPMSRGEAAKLLGVVPDADAEAISEAHRRLIARVHPDAGGSSELAARINEARDVMLKR
jgi:DnaJ homolog subfamily C member 19